MKFTKTGDELGIPVSHGPLKTREELGTKEYERLRHNYLGLAEARGEPSVMGENWRPTKEQAYQMMQFRMPNLKEIRISRMVFERPDLQPADKLVFGVLCSFQPVAPRLTVSEIAGLCGLSYQKALKALYNLEQYKLIRIIKNYYARKRRAPSTYIVLPYASRFREEARSLGPFVSKRRNLEESIREQFNI